MNTTIFYFSATGNSLNIARNIANKLGNCELIPIAKAIRNEKISTNTSRIGFIFPVFAWGMPRIVEEFVNKLNINNKAYIFAVASCVAIQGNTLKDLKNTLLNKGLDLNAGFAVKSGRSSLMKLNALDNIIIRLDFHRLRIKTAAERLPEIINIIEKNGKHKAETSSWTANLFGSMFHSLALKKFKNIDSDFIIADNCKSCGNCVKICPRNNIQINNNRPEFQHNCELCHACIQWCPNFAIKHPNFDNSLKQYHNNAVNVQDMIINI